MVTSPLPYNTEVEVVVDQFCYCIRLTPCDQYCEQSVADFFSDNEQFFEKWVYCSEISEENVFHFHLVIYTPLKIEDMRLKIRDFIYPFFPDRGRGFGNKQYNIQYSKDPRAAISYCLKHPETLEWSGFSEECIDQLKSESFVKITFDSEVVKLNEDFCKKDSGISDADYLSSYYKLCAKYFRTINPTTINGYLLSAKVRKDPSFADEYAKFQISKLF